MSDASDSASAEAVLEVDNLSVRFDQGNTQVQAVSNLSYRVAAGQTVAIIGESGSGKTVAARAVVGILPENAVVSGSVRLEGKELVGMRERELRRYRAKGMSMVFQDPTRSLNPTMRIGAQVAEAMLRTRMATKKTAKDSAIQLLRMVRLPAPERRYYEYPHQLSGGMRQRVMIAIALSCRPKALIADEATTALDVTTQAEIMDLLVDLQQEFNMALVLISHNLGLAWSYADEVVVMYAGRSVEQAATDVLFARPRMPYTQLLLEAIPEIDRPAHGLLPRAPGSPPDLRHLPPGCAFAPRCPRARDECRSEVPALQSDEPGHSYACRFPLGVKVDA